MSGHNLAPWARGLAVGIVAIAFPTAGLAQTGACCFPDDICFDGVDGTDCLLIKGRFLGHGSTCNGGLFSSRRYAIEEHRSATPADGDERQFLAILANPLKEYKLTCQDDADCANVNGLFDVSTNFTCDTNRSLCVLTCATDEDCARRGEFFVCDPDWGSCTLDLPNPQLIRAQYFNNPEGTFADYWREISYGDVTISGEVTDWITLPWRVRPIETEGQAGVDLNGDGSISYGQGEDFDNHRAMVIVDIDGDPFGIDNGPYSPFENPAYAQGGQDFHSQTGQRIWMPGERFVDVDLDGRWDGLDEANNNM
ncbi:MAG: hypothetical protein JSU86_00505, partial [Phycisphaerales bacterium]